MRDRLPHNFWLGIAGLIIVLLLPPATVILVFKQDIQFDPSGFVDGYLGFFCTLLSILFGFGLVQMYWESKLDAERGQRVRRLFLSHLNEIGNLGSETKEIHERHAMTPEEHNQIESEVRAHITRLEDASWSVVRFMEDWRGTTDEELTAQLSIFMRDVVPQIERLSKMRDVGPGDTEAHRLIAHITERVRDIRDKLGR